MKKFLLSLLLIVAGAAAAKADVVTVMSLSNDKNAQPALQKDYGTSGTTVIPQVSYNACYGGYTDNAFKPKDTGWHFWRLAFGSDNFLGFPAGNEAPVAKLTTNFTFEKPLAEIAIAVRIPTTGMVGSFKVYASDEKFPIDGSDLEGAKLIGEWESDGKARTRDNPLTIKFGEAGYAKPSANQYYQIIFNGTHSTYNQNLLRLFQVDYRAKEDFSCSFLNTDLFLNETAKLVKPAGEKVPTVFTFTDENGVVEVTDDVDSFLVTPKKVGKTTVTASWEENDYYLAGSTTFEVNVLPLVLGQVEAKLNGATPIVNEGQATIKSGNSISIYAKNAESIEVKQVDGDVVWSAEGENTVWTPAEPEYTESHNYVITAKMGDSVETLSFELTVSKDAVAWSHVFDAVELVEFDTTALHFGEPHPALKFISENEEVATIDENGVITAKQPGETRILVSWDSDVNFTAGNSEFKVVVTEKPRLTYIPSFSTLGKVIFTDNEMKLDLGEVVPGSLAFTSSNEAVATVNNQGIVTKVGVGEAEITCTWDRDHDFLAGEAMFNVFVPEGKAIVKAGANYAGSLDKEVATGTPIKDPIEIADFVKISFGAPEEVANVFSGSGNIIFEPAKGVALQKIVFPTTGAYNGYISLAGGDGSVKLENGVITWVGPAAEGNGHGEGTVKINATRAVKVPYFEVYYTQKNPDVRLSFNEATAEYKIGHENEFNAPVLSVDVDASVDEAAAKAAVVYKSSNEAIAKVVADGLIEGVAPGTVTISAFIPEENEDFFSTIAKYTLTVSDPDREILTAAVMGATRTGKFERFTTINTRENGSEIVYQAVFSKTDDGAMRFFKGGDGWGSGVYVTENLNGEGIASVKITFAEGKAGEGVKVYARTYAFDEPQLRTAPVFSSADALVMDNVKENVEITLDGYSAFAIVPVASQSEVIVESVTVKYSNEKVTYAKLVEVEEVLSSEVYTEPVAVSANSLPAGDPMADAVTKLTVDKALHYSLNVQANTNASAMKFTFEDQEWTVAAKEGDVHFTAEYLTAPKETSELSFCALDADGEVIESTTGATKLKFEHYPSSAANVGLDILDNQIEARYDVPADTYKIGDVYNNSYIKDWKLETEEDVKKAAQLDAKNVILDLRLYIDGNHTNHPCMVLCSASLRQVDEAGNESTLRSLESDYDLEKHEVVVKRVHTFPYNAVVNNSNYVANQISSWNPDKLNVATHVYFPVVKATKPVVTDHNNTPSLVARKFSKAADTETTVEAVKATRGDNPAATQVLAVNPGDVNKFSDDGVVTGIEDVMVDAAVADGEAEFFNLQGVRILNPAKGQVVIRRQANGQVDKIRF